MGIRPSQTVWSQQPEPEAGVAADHGEAAASLGDELDGPVELFLREGGAGDVAADDDVVAEQLLAGGGEAEAAVGNALESLGLVVLGIDLHREALDVGVFDEGLVG